MIPPPISSIPFCHQNANVNGGSTLEEQFQCHAHSGIVEAIKRLDGWQKTQNGTLQRIDAKIDKLVYWIMGEMAAVILLAVSIFLKG